MENQDLAAILMSQATLGDPIRYANLMRATKSEEIASLKELLPKMKNQLEVFERTAKQAKELRKQVSGEGYARRRKDAKKVFGGLDQQKDQFRGPGVDLSVMLSSHYENVTNMYSTLVQGAELICNARMISFDESVDTWAEGLDKSQNELGEDRLKALLSKANEARSDALQNLAMEQRVNQGAQTSFLHGLMMLERVAKQYEDYLLNQSRIFEAYYERLRHRHANGTVIADYLGAPSVTLTDVSILVWENIDRVGEIEDGHDANEISAFTLHRAYSMIDAAKHGEVWPWIVDPGKQLLSWANNALPTVKAVKDFVVGVKQMLGESTWRQIALDPDKSLSEFTSVVDSLALEQITQRAPEQAYSKTERFMMDHQNTSIQKVADMLVTGEGLQSIVDEIIKLKVEAHNFFVNENSFYVCKIGTGNPFGGEAPGAIEVIPGEKPNAALDNIWGGGFGEIRDFIEGMQTAKKWSPLFLSTSPSGSTDKNNVLLVGPQGCGKTQVMRALGADDDSISIFAVGSDFLTCWMGEAQKNPKRLFDEAVKLHKSSGRPVHILIDEIDMVLNDDKTSGSRVNLSLEFQNLMDGVVAYPGISIWGATNHPKRIPTPMLRRFAKVMVVGELDIESRVTILRHYIEHFLPCGEGFSDEQYNRWAIRFDGATGDVIRKAVDEIWLRLMRSYISGHEASAEKVLEFINEQYGDNFEVSELTDEDAQTIRNMIGETSVVTVDLVEECISHLLDNFAVQQQIKVARDTYRNAALLLERQKTDSSVGF
jgi:hypothetical protein